MKRLRANTLKDHCNFLLHFGLAAGVTTGAFVALGCPPVLGVIALGATAGVHLGLMPKVKRAFQQAINEEKSDGLGPVTINLDTLERDLRQRRRINPWEYINQSPTVLQPKVQRWVDTFSQKLGLRAPPSVALMERGPTIFSHQKNQTLKDGLREFLRDKFNQNANAFAFSHSQDNIVLNAPIVEQLNPRELKGVVGHEIGHIAASHSAKLQMLGCLSSPAQLLTSLNLIVTAFSAWKNAGYYFLGTAIGGAAAGVVCHMLDLSEKDQKDVPKIKTLRNVFSNAAITGLGIVGGAPDLVAAIGLNAATQLSLKLINRRYSRCAEFQADKIAARLTGDPQGLSEGLNRIGKLHQSPTLDPYEIVAPERKKDRGFLCKLFAPLGDLTKTHPSVDRRCARLEKMEQRAEYIYA